MQNDASPTDPRLARTVDAFRDLVVHNLFHTHGQDIESANLHDAYMALSYAVRDHLVDRWRSTNVARHDGDSKVVHYLSAEYLPGKQLEQNLLYSGTTEVAREALAEAGVDLQRLLDLDVEPGLGNGGLGRLAACFMESLASLDVPAIGYGMRYQFGIFRQEFQDGWQVERPDDWGRFGNPWEFRQPSDMVEVGLFGHTETYEDPGGGTRTRWVPGEEILGEPHVILVPGYGTRTVNILRLWRAKATEQFDFELFDTGDYARAVEQKVRSENISKVLYPNDSTPQGEELRLKQQYFFVACSLQDILARFRLRHEDWDLLPDKAVVQLNDTHPVVAIPELMRLLIDDHGLDWSRAWSITRRTFAYTCHTLLPEALETWSVELFGRLLPRHLEIVYEINGRFLEDIRARFPDDEERVARMSIIGEGDDRRIRMAHLATVGSFGVNGVAELHTRLLTEHTLSDFAELWPDRFHNKTNGVTPRRFVRIANPRLSELITSAIGDGWISNLESLSELEGFADDRSFQESWREVKRQNKEELAGIVRERTGVELFPGSIYDVLVKRLHEYKRQLLKVLHVVWLYQRIKAEPGRHVHPRTFLFGAKAAPGYHMAKRIIRLVHAVADVVNADRDVDGRLRVAFPANFNVSLAERIYPAADISEQISLAGKEASGTGNMKFALNGALTVGTLDGANVEIRERVGEENFFLFGMSVDEVLAKRAAGYDPRAVYEADEELRAVVDALLTEPFTGGDAELFREVVDSLLDRDEYFVLEDFRSYVECSEEAALAYADQDRWTRMSILNAARCGYFSSDRSMRQYCDELWGVKPVPVD